MSSVPGRWKRMYRRLRTMERAEIADRVRQHDLELVSRLCEGFHLEPGPFERRGDVRRQRVTIVHRS